MDIHISRSSILKSFACTLFIRFLHHSCVASATFPRDRDDAAASANPLMIKGFMLLTEQSRGEQGACVFRQSTEILLVPSEGGIDG